MAQTTVPDGRTGYEEQRRSAAVPEMEAEKIGPPWKQDPATGDLYPDPDSGGDVGIGTIDKAIGHVAIGTQEPTGESGLEGLLYENDDLNGGGVFLVGLRDIDPANPPSPLVENAPVGVLGNPVLLGNQVMLQLTQAITEDHEIVLGPSTNVDGRHFAPIHLGPKKVYSQTETATDVQDIDVLDLGEVEIVSLTLANSYVVGATFTFQVYLENLGTKETLFAAILKVDGVEAARYPRSFVASGGVVSNSFPIDAPINAAQVISLDVEATNTGPQSQGWVRGTIQPTTIRIQQG